MNITKAIRFSNRSGQEAAVTWSEEVEVFFYMVQRCRIHDRKIMHIKMARTLFDMGLRDAEIMMDDAYDH